MCRNVGAMRRFGGPILIGLALFLLVGCDSFSFYTEVDGRGGLTGAHPAASRADEPADVCLGPQ